ncbi:hypothetical protein KY092_17105 [Natronomonas gomsonensis]|uniref:hypothetical protein n=1 Tax=Natronomonas gomsonensis TaxID=1046043 RepID=UPI0020CA5B81|nr:hypothetical protein [Natronomonas gomsonensis]MCY4732273.1 hypothetical protein [Natronomonas gomsonensis]
MDVLGDAIDRQRRTSDTALRAPAVGRAYDYRRFCTSAWKVGNFLRHLGVRSGAGVAVADDPIPEPVLTFYGAALLGGVVRFDPAESVGDDTRALVVPVADLGEYDAGPSTKQVAYGGQPDDPTVSYFERDVWSENPTEPPDHITPSDPLLATSEATYSHGDVLGAATEVIDDHGVASDTTVAVRGSFTAPGVVTAGLVAPIVAGGTVVVGPGAEGDLVVGGPNSDIAVGTLLG